MKVLETITMGKKLQWNVLLVSISVFILIMGCQPNSSGSEVDRIEIHKIDWYYSVRYRLDVKDVKPDRRGYKKVVLDSDEEINEIVDRLDKLKPLPDFSDVDVRMYCVFIYEGGKRDTLKVGRPYIYKFGNQVYDEDSTLLNILKETVQ